MNLVPERVTKPVEGDPVVEDVPVVVEVEALVVAVVVDAFVVEVEEALVVEVVVDAFVVDVAVVADLVVEVVVVVVVGLAVVVVVVVVVDGGLARTLSINASLNP